MQDAVRRLRSALPLLAPLVLPPAAAPDPVEPPPGPSGDLADGTSSEESWLDLDARLAGVEGLVPHEGKDAVRLGVLLRAFYAYSDASVATGSGPDVSGFALQDADLSLEADLGDYSVRLSFDLDEGGTALEDAYARWRVTDSLELQLGSFKPRVLLSNAVDPDALVFTDRTVLGALFDTWDVGAQARYRLDEIDVYVSVTNGADGTAADHRWVGRFEWPLFDAEWTLHEGAHGAPDFLRVILGGVYVHDDAAGMPDADAYGFDLFASLGPTALAAEWMELDGGFDGSARTSPFITLPVDGGSHPFALTVSQLVLDDLQASFRYQHLDDDASSELYGGALDWYPGDGPVAFVADVTGYDREGPDGLVVQVGLRVGSSRP